MVHRCSSFSSYSTNFNRRTMSSASTVDNDTQDSRFLPGCLQCPESGLFYDQSKYFVLIESVLLTESLRNWAGLESRYFLSHDFLHSFVSQIFHFSRPLGNSSVRAVSPQLGYTDRHLSKSGLLPPLLKLDSSIATWELLCFVCKNRCTCLALRDPVRYSSTPVTCEVDLKLFTKGALTHTYTVVSVEVPFVTFTFWILLGSFVCCSFVNIFLFRFSLQELLVQTSYAIDRR